MKKIVLSLMINCFLFANAGNEQEDTIIKCYTPYLTLVKKLNKTIKGKIDYKKYKKIKKINKKLKDIAQDFPDNKEVQKTCKKLKLFMEETPKPVKS